MEALSHIEGLNRRFGIAGTAEIVAGRGGLPVVRISTAAVEAEVSLYGAQVLSWRPAGAGEVLFVSERSQWMQGRAIRGGIPVCFPWFRSKADDPKAPKHGFVRTREWRLDSLSAAEDGTVTMVCVTASDPAARALWPHEFLIAYRITAGKTLRLELSVINRGAGALSFEEALHAYFRVGQVRDVRVHGLDGLTYLDNTDGSREKRQQGEMVPTAQTDSAFLSASGGVDIADPALRRTLRIVKQNSSATVVWNPWSDGAAAMSDLGPDEWQHMLCVEPANILSAAVTLASGEEHTMHATISVLPIDPSL